MTASADNEIFAKILFPFLWQTTFSNTMWNTITWKKMFVFLFEFYCILFLRVLSIISQCVNSVPLYVRKLHFVYELVRTSSKYRWSIYRTSGKCRWSIYRTPRKRRGTLRVVHKSGTEFTHSEYDNIESGNHPRCSGPFWQDTIDIPSNL